MLSARSQNNVKVNYVVILRAGIRGNIITYTLKYRLDKGIEYLNLILYFYVFFIIK